MHSFIRQKHEQAVIVYTCAHVTALEWEQGMPGGTVEYWLTDIYPNGSVIHSDSNRMEAFRFIWKAAATVCNCFYGPGLLEIHP